MIKQTKKYEIFERVSDTNSQEEPSSYTFYHSAWTFHYSGYWIMIKNIPVIQVYTASQYCISLDHPNDRQILLSPHPPLPLSIIFSTMCMFPFASSSLAAVIQICRSVGMFSLALFKTFLAFSYVSRRARANQSCKIKGKQWFIRFIENWFELVWNAVEKYNIPLYMYSF